MVSFLFSCSSDNIKINEQSSIVVSSNPSELQEEVSAQTVVLARYILFHKIPAKCRPAMFPKLPDRSTNTGKAIPKTNKYPSSYVAGIIAREQQHQGRRVSSLICDHLEQFACA